jgi:hypothetical protein
LISRSQGREILGASPRGGKQIGKFIVHVVDQGKKQQPDSNLNRNTSSPVKVTSESKKRSSSGSKSASNGSHRQLNNLTTLQKRLPKAQVDVSSLSPISSPTKNIIRDAIAKRNKKSTPEFSSSSDMPSDCPEEVVQFLARNEV